MNLLEDSEFKKCLTDAMAKLIEAQNILSGSNRSVSDEEAALHSRCQDAVDLVHELVKSRAGK